MRWIIGTLFMFFAAGSFGGASLGCGDGACGDAGETLCAKACTCGGCVISANGIKIDFEDEGDCNALFDLSCDNDDGSIDWNKCAADLPKAECDGDAVVSPASCN